MHRRQLAAAIVVSGGLTSLPTTALVLALPAIHHDFHSSVSELQWTLTAYSLAYAAFLVVGGRLADLFGRVRFFELGVAVWVGATFLAGLATNATMLIGAMGLLGIGSAALTPASLALLTSTWSGPQRAKAMSAWALASAVTSGAGPTAGGLLTADLSWRWIFWVSAAISAVTLALTFFARTRDSRADEAPHIDVPGALLLVTGMTTLSLALIQGPEWEFYAWPTLVTFGFSALVLAWFVFVERRQTLPIVELPLLRVPEFVGGVVVKLGVNFSMAAFFFFISLYMQEVLGYSPEQAGWGLLPLTVPFLAAVPVGTRLGVRFGARVPILIGLTLAIASFLLLSTIDKRMHYEDLLPAILLLGIGAGLVVTPMNAAPMNAIPQHQHGEAAGILQMTTGLGSVLGVALGGALFQEMHERRLTDFLRAARGHSIPEATQHQLSGVLVHAPAADKTLARFDKATADAIVRGVREAFVYGISSTMLLSAGVLCVGVVAAVALMRRSSLTVSS